MQDNSNSRRTEAMQVNNVSFLLERLGKDCEPLQFVRELTVNSIEAIQQSGNSVGELIWDMDWNRQKLNGSCKLSIIDSGVGMTGPEMVRYINRLSCSGKGQSLDGNFGVGAKVAAATRNPLGLIYLSWKDGKGSMVHLWRNPETQVYGLRVHKVPREDGEFEYRTWSPIDEALKPVQIRDSGTMVVLLGSADDENTMVAPEGVTPRSRWLARYLNTRFYRFPKGISVKAREGWDSQSKECDRLRTITGAKPFLDKWSQAFGSVALEGAIAYWWILRPECKKHNLYAGGGHIAALYKDELYELKTGRAGSTSLQTFGVFVEHNRVVIYVEPSAQGDIATNTARTQLILDKKSLPWTDWATTFRNNFPDELAVLIETSQRPDSSNHDRAIRERLKSVEDLYKIKKYQPKEHGPESVSLEGTVGGGSIQKQRLEKSLTQIHKHSKERTRRGQDRIDGDVYSLFLRSDANAAEEVDDRLRLDVRWVTESDLGVADRAAHYVAETRTLLINKEFRVFEQFIERWRTRYGHLPAAFLIIEDVSREWFQQLLVELIYSVEFLRGDQEWTDSDIQTMLSDEALTAAVLPRYHTEMAVRKTLSVKLGSLKERASA